VSGPAALSVDETGIATVAKSDRFSEGVVKHGDCDEVDVIGHQAVRDDFEGVTVGVITEEGAVHVTVLGGEENVLASVASVGDMVRAFGDDDSCESGHG